MNRSEHPERIERLRRAFWRAQHRYIHGPVSDRPRLREARNAAAAAFNAAVQGEKR